MADEGHDDIVATVQVPCRPGALLDFSWGTGMDMRLIERASATGSNVPAVVGLEGGAPYVSSVSWCVACVARV
jgi:hypothetical protein